MKFIRYSKFDGFDVFGVDLGELMDALSDSMLTPAFMTITGGRWSYKPDESIDALRQAILKALLEKGILSEHDVEKMLADNDGKFRGSLLEELINKLIERLVEEGYLRPERDPAGTASRTARGGNGPGEVGERFREISSSK